MLSLELYKKMYRIRCAEEAIIREYDKNEMKTPMHMSMGSEAIAAGVIMALGSGAKLFSSYRSHAVYIACTDETRKFFAEMYGKTTGVARGKAGSMHLSSPETGYMGASAVVASILPVAAGAAYANKVCGVREPVAVFFGDGAVEEGVFWETLNLACLLKLPLVFVCEDNGYAVHTPASQRRGYDSLDEIVCRYHCFLYASSSTDVEEIYLLSSRALQTLRSCDMPVFLHLQYYRYLEHVGVYEDFAAGYRTKKEFEEWYSRDPVLLQRARLCSQGKEAEVCMIEEEIQKEVDASVTAAKSDPFPEPDELYEGVFYDGANNTL